MRHTMIHENLKKFMDGFHHDAHPMGMLISTVAALSTFYPDAHNIKRPQGPAQADRPPDRQDAHPGRLRLPPSPGPALHLSRSRALLHQELHEHAVEAHRAEVRGQPGAGARAGSALHPACRPRAELQHQHHARGGQLQRRPLRHHGRGHRRALRPAARRRQRGSAAHAGRDRLQRNTSPTSSSRSRTASAS